MVDKSIKNAKCMICNRDFTVSATQKEGTVICPHCGEENDIVKSIRFYKSFFDATKSEKRTVHGDLYFKYRQLLDVGEHYILNEDYEKAKTSFNDAIELNHDDYRGYFGLVKCETSNFNDFKNESHKEFLNKAIKCADSEGQAVIGKIYRPYFAKCNMTESEHEEYLIEKLRSEKIKVKKSILALSPLINEKEKHKKTFLFSAIVSIVVGVACLTIGLLFNLGYMALFGVVAVFVAYALGRGWFNSKNTKNLYDFIIELYKFTGKNELTAKQNSEIISYIWKFINSIKNGEQKLIIENTIMDLCADIEKTKDKNAIVFLKGEKLTQLYIDDAQQ